MEWTAKVVAIAFAMRKLGIKDKDIIKIIDESLKENENKNTGNK